jgi:hypothetical protein
VLSHFALAEQQEVFYLAVPDMCIPQICPGIFCRSVCPSNTATKTNTDTISLCAHVSEYTELIIVAVGG